MPCPPSLSNCYRVKQSCPLSGVCVSISSIPFKDDLFLFRICDPSLVSFRTKSSLQYKSIVAIPIFDSIDYSDITERRPADRPHHPPTITYQPLRSLAMFSLHSSHLAHTRMSVEISFVSDCRLGLVYIGYGGWKKMSCLTTGETERSETSIQICHS